MNIRLTDDYRITSDPLQYILQHRMVHQKTKEEYWVNEGYYGSLETLFKGLVHHEIVSSDISSLPEIIHVVQGLISEISTNVEKVIGELDD